MKKIMIILVLPVLFISCARKENKVAALDRESFTTVKVANVIAEAVSDSLHVAGLLATENEATLSFKMGGVIDRIYVSEGAFVKRGQLLASLKITEINSQLDQAKLSFEKAQRDYVRASNLYKDSVATLEQMQNAKTALEVAQRSVDAITFNRQYAFIKAEADGFITSKPGNEGEVTAPGTPVITIDEATDNRDFLLRVGITDEEWTSVYTGQKAFIQLDAYANKTFTGSVYRKSRSADMAGGSFQVDIKVSFDGETPAVGMFGKATLVPGKPIKEYTIPYEALIQVSGNKASVYVPAENNSLKKIDVIIRSFNEKNVIVQSGIQEGQQVVISNNAFLNEKSKIAITQ